MHSAYTPVDFNYEKSGEQSPAFIFSLWILLLCRCSYGTSVRAGTAADALVLVDNVLAIALGDAAHGTSIGASATADALIRNLVCHCYVPP